MIKIKRLISTIERLAPLSLQEEYDNSGLIIGNPDEHVECCMICLDVSEEVIDEAVDRGARLIISHHPLIFGKLTSITNRTPVERIVTSAIRSGISIYAVHTNLDSTEQGVSNALSVKLGLTDLQVLRKGRGMLRKLVTFTPLEHAEKVRKAVFDAGAGHIGSYDQCSFNVAGEGSFKGDDSTHPFVGDKGRLHFENEVRFETVFPFYLEREIVAALLEAHPYEEVAYDIYKLENDSGITGMGMTGYLKQAMPEDAFMRHLKETLRVPCIRHSRLTGKEVKKVAVCGGSGIFLLPDAIKQAADFFVTADVKYHQFQQAGGGIVIADVGHFESEQFTCELLADHLKKNFPNFAVLISDSQVNPVNYF